MQAELRVGSTVFWQAWDNLPRALRIVAETSRSWCVEVTYRRDGIVKLPKCGAWPREWFPTEADALESKRLYELRRSNWELAEKIQKAFQNHFWRDADPDAARRKLAEIAGILGLKEEPDAGH